MNSGGFAANSAIPSKTYFGSVGRKVGNEFIVDRQVRCQHEEVTNVFWRNRYVINAPISRVLPTPVATAKHIQGKSRSKSLDGGEFDRYRL